MASRLIHSVVVAALLLYAVVQYDRHSAQILPSSVSGFLPDFLALPVVLGCILLAFRWITGIAQLRLPTAMVVIAVVAFAIVFEGVLPHTQAVYISDWWDVLAYILGGGFFAWIQTKSGSAGIPPANPDRVEGFTEPQ